MEENVFELRVFKIISMLFAISSLVLIIVHWITGLNLMNWSMICVIISVSVNIISDQIDFGFNINRDNNDNLNA